MTSVFGVCGIYCELCPVYDDERCEGCFKRNQLIKPACTLFLCATDKGLDCCFKCKEFPCETHYKEDMVYTRESLNTWKDLMSRPKEYFIQVKERFKKKAWWQENVSARYNAIRLHSESLAREAAYLRAKCDLLAPDAIVAASALGKDALVTNDETFKTVKEIKVVLLNELEL